MAVDEVWCIHKSHRDGDDVPRLMEDLETILGGLSLLLVGLAALDLGAALFHDCGMHVSVNARHQ